MADGDHPDRSIPEPSEIHAVVVDHADPDPHLELVARSLADTHVVTRHMVSLPDTVRHLTGEARRTHEAFDHTPPALIDAWVYARAMAAVVPDGATALVPDRAGVGGVAALVESQRPADRRRRIWAVAGSGRWLHDTLAHGTAEHVALPEAAEIDWELVTYRRAERVLATAHTTAGALEHLGIPVDVPAGIAAPTGPAGARRDVASARRVFAPGPVSRTNRSGDVMRAVLGIPGTELTVGIGDVADAVWAGTTWEASRAAVERLGSRLHRGATPDAATDLVVVGDPLAVPDDTIASLRDAGIRIAAPAGSVVATLWPDTVEWRTADDLAAVIEGRPLPAAGRPESTGGTVARSGDPGRARRVSVGIPAFGDPRYLDECVASVLAQTEPVFEILITDDGSQSASLDAALDRWQASDERIRVLRQPNRGVCVARNRMLDAMSGDAFVLVDQDDVLNEEFVAATATALRADRSLSAVAVWTEFFGAYHAIEAKPPFDRRVAHRENPIVSTAALVDMAVRDDGVRFEPDLAFLYCEDWNFWSRIVAAGGSMGLVPAPLIRHRVHRASGGFQRTELALQIGKARALAPFGPPRSF